MNFPNRVPVFANPHDGSSICSLSKAFQATSASPSFIIASPFGPSPFPLHSHYFLRTVLIRTPSVRAISIRVSLSTRPFSVEESIVSRDLLNCPDSRKAPAAAPKFPPPPSPPMQPARRLCRSTRPPAPPSVSRNCQSSYSRWLPQQLLVPSVPPSNG